MPSFITLDPSLAPRTLLVPGRPQYVWGSYDSKSSPTLAYVTNVAANGSSATVTLAVYGGVAPYAGQEVTIRGCSDSRFDVQGVTVSAVSGFDTGDKSVGTVTFALAQAVSSAAATGMATLPVAEIPEALADGASLQVSVPFNDPRISQERSVTAQVFFPVEPDTAVITLELSDDDENYYPAIDPDTGNAVVIVTFPSSPPVSGGFAQITESAARFYRLVASGVTGTLPTVIGKISA